VLGGVDWIFEYLGVCFFFVFFISVFFLMLGFSAR